MRFVPLIVAASIVAGGSSSALAQYVPQSPIDCKLPTDALTYYCNHRDQYPYGWIDGVPPGASATPMVVHRAAHATAAQSAHRPAR
jgi:hypothetical protein